MLRLLREWLPKLIIEFHKGVDRGPITRRLVDVGYQETGFPIESADAGPHDYLDDRSYLFQAVQAA
jgi:hypothetical protein